MAASLKSKTAFQKNLAAIQNKFKTMVENLWKTFGSAANKINKSVKKAPKAKAAIVAKPVKAKAAVVSKSVKAAPAKVSDKPVAKSTVVAKPVKASVKK